MAVSRQEKVTGRLAKQERKGCGKLREIGPMQAERKEALIRQERLWERLLSELSLGIDEREEVEVVVRKGVVLLTSKEEAVSKPGEKREL
jgi:hypothetical protein